MKIYDVIDNISRKIKEENCKSLFKEIGYITKVSDGIAIIIGLENVELNEIIEFQDKTRGIVFSIEENNIRAVILGKDKNIKAGGKS
jgi:F-type H+-transporting ATPase subunit alpha